MQCVLAQLTNGTEQNPCWQWYRQKNATHSGRRENVGTLERKYFFIIVLQLGVFSTTQLILLWWCSLCQIDVQHRHCMSSERELNALLREVSHNHLFRLKSKFWSHPLQRVDFTVLKLMTNNISLGKCNYLWSNTPYLRTATYAVTYLRLVDPSIGIKNSQRKREVFGEWCSLIW